MFEDVPYNEPVKEYVSASIERGSTTSSQTIKLSISNINKGLENQMQLAQIMSSSILSLRKKEKIRVRQPLVSALVAVSNEGSGR